MELKEVESDQRIRTAARESRDPLIRTFGDFDGIIANSIRHTGKHVGRASNSETG